MLAPKPEATLYERLGGKSAIQAVVNDFIDRVGADPRITNEKVKARLGAIHIPALKVHVTNQVCAAAGGPCEYTGRDMISTHAGLEITNAEFDYTTWWMIWSQRWIGTRCRSGRRAKCLPF